MEEKERPLAPELSLRFPPVLGVQRRAPWDGLELEPCQSSQILAKKMNFDHPSPHPAFRPRPQSPPLLDSLTTVLYR